MSVNYSAGLPVWSSMQSMAPDQYRPGVLIVDDNESVRSFLRTAIEATARVIEAHDAEHALKILENRGRDTIDLMVVDCVLPGCSGLDLLRITKRNWPGISVIILTGFGSEDLAVEAFREGATDYLRKPITPDALMATVAVALTSTDNALRDPRHFAERSTGAALWHPNIHRARRFWRTLMSLRDVVQEVLNPMMRRFEIRIVMGLWVLLLVIVLMIYIFTGGLGQP